MVPSSSALRLGLVGIGLMGRGHASRIVGGEVPGLELAAIHDSDPAARAHYPEIPFFDSIDTLLGGGRVDAVLIATPHTSHVSLAIAALQAGLPVLIEKPLAAEVAEAHRLIAVQRACGLRAGIVFNQRTDPRYIQARHWIQNGEIGALQRVNWIITDWYRPNAYYRHGEWRATWAGEGGGVLLNQCPHNLDLLVWLCGRPARVRGFCGFGKYHPIEVEDEVTAYLEYANGATGVFITSTGEAPGTNRLEITGNRGRIVIEGDRVAITRLAIGAAEFCASTDDKFVMPAQTHEVLEITERGLQHTGILRNFTAAVRGKEPLIAAAEEGLNSLELANAILLSAFEQRAVDLPLDASHYAAHLRRLIQNSSHPSP